jgi:hypothetical protein
MQLNESSINQQFLSLLQETDAERTLAHLADGEKLQKTLEALQGKEQVELFFFFITLGLELSDTTVYEP